MDALKSAGLADYPDTSNIPCTSPPLTLNTGDTCRDEVLRITSKIYDDLGSMDHMTVSERVSTFRQYSSELEKVACVTSRGYKIAVAEIISLKNCLANKKMGNSYAAIRPTAIDNTLQRSQIHMLQNNSRLISANLTTSVVRGRSARKTGTRRETAHGAVTSLGSLCPFTALTTTV